MNNSIKEGQRIKIEDTKYTISKIDESFKGDMFIISLVDDEKKKTFISTCSLDWNDTFNLSRFSKC